MFDISVAADGGVKLVGRLDASQVEKARVALNEITSSCVVDFQELEYISSAGLGVLLSAQKRLTGAGHTLRLANLNRHIREIFTIAGFDRIFEII